MSEHIELSDYDREPLPDLIRLRAPNAGMMTGTGTNTWILADGAIVVDPGPADPAHVDAILESCIVEPQAVFVTHTHKDHSPGAAMLAARCKANLIGQGAPLGFPDRQDESFAPDHVPKHDEQISVAGQHIIAIHTPGHASNHYCYLHEATGTLFSGDHINQGATVVIPPPDGSMQAYLNSMQLLRDYPINFIAPGHGALIDDPDQIITRLIRHRLLRESKVMRVLAAIGPATIDELLPLVYDDVKKELLPVAAYSLEAHLLKLEEDEAALCESRQWLPIAR